MSQLITGDAVVLGLRPAKVPSRALSVLLDLVVVWTVYLAVSFALLTATASLDDAAFAAVQVALLVLLLVGGPIAVETLSRGRSLGKLACGLRVVREDGGPIRFRHALMRGAMGFVEIQLSFGVIACASSLVSARGRRLGDVFAGTLVVRERIPVAGPATLPAPPAGAAGQFAALDFSQVPDGLWLAVRQYLMRMRQLDPQVSSSMAQRLAADLSACTGTPPPTGVPAPDYLAGLVAERQARDARRASAARPASAEMPPGWPHTTAPSLPETTASPPGTDITASPPGPQAGASSSRPPETESRPRSGPAAPREEPEGSDRPGGTGFAPPA